MTMHKQSIAVVGMVMFVVLGGCQQNSTSTSRRQPAPSEQSPPPTVVSPSASDSSSPATVALLPVPLDATPDQVVAAFLEALRSGDEKRAAALLTDKARQETRRENLVVQPPGTPDAQFSVGDVKYVTEQKDGAHVTSIWTEKDEQGQPQTYEIIWILRRQPHNGWRIAGMATELVPGEPPLFLNFEDPKDMLSKWEQANQELAQQQRNSSTVRQAQTPTPPNAETLQR